MNIIKHLVTLVCSLGSMLSLFGQATEQEVPPPKFPLTLRAPQKATWTITVNGRGSSAEPRQSDEDKVEQLSSLSVVKTAPIYQEIGMTKDGKGWERWVFVTPTDTFRLVQNVGGNGWERMPDTYYGEIARYENLDFGDFEWIDEKNYKGVEMVDSKPTYFFEQSSSTPITRRDREFFDPGDVERKDTFVARGWIDSQTLLPIKFEDSRETRTFAYGQAPTAHLSPPPPVLVELKKWAEEIRRINR